MNCPDGDAINQNVVVNAVDNGFFLDPENSMITTVRRDL